MPPSDELFAPAATDAPTPETTPAPAAPETPAPLTQEQVAALVEQRTAPVAQQLTALQRENDALKLAIQQSAGQQQARPAPAAEDFVTQFNRDPSAAIKSIADQSSSEGLRQLAPHLQTLIGSANEAFLGAQQTRIEGEFGTKAWEDIYRPALADRFAAIRRENPFAVADINRVRQEVDTITGANFSKIIALRDDHLKGRSTASEAERAALIAEARKGITTNLTGGIRNTPKGAVPELSDDMKAAIADMDRHTGQRTNAGDWAKKMVAAQNSRDVDEWLANTKVVGRA